MTVHFEPTCEPDCGDMVRIPAAGETTTFPMGAPEGEPWSNSDQRPVHDVTLTAYRIDRFEVTVADYAACVDSGEPERFGSQLGRDAEADGLHAGQAQSHVVGYPTGAAVVQDEERVGQLAGQDNRLGLTGPQAVAQRGEEPPVRGRLDPQPVGSSAAVLCRDRRRHDRRRVALAEQIEPAERPQRDQAARVRDDELRRCGGHRRAPLVGSSRKRRPCGPESP